MPETKENLVPVTDPYFLLFRYRTLPLILINLLLVPESMSDLLSFNRTDSIALSPRDKSGLIVIPGCVDSLDLPERIRETSEALVSLTSKGRERFSSYLPNLKQSRIESSFTDSLIDEKIVTIDDGSLEFRICLGVPFELSLRPKTIRFYFLSLPLLELTLPLF